jgi:hypothetical protein
VYGTEPAEYLRLSTNHVGAQDAFSGYGYRSSERYNVVSTVFCMYSMMIIPVDLPSLPSPYSHAEQLSKSSLLLHVVTSMSTISSRCIQRIQVEPPCSYSCFKPIIDKYTHNPDFPSLYRISPQVKPSTAGKPPDSQPQSCSSGAPIKTANAAFFNRLLRFSHKVLNLWSCPS